MREGRRFGERSFTIHLAATPTDHARLGIAVGRKVSPKAVIRNTIKRIIRDNFRRQATTLPALDIVFSARRPAATASRSELAKDVASALRRIKSSQPVIEKQSNVQAS